MNKKNKIALILLVIVDIAFLPIAIFFIAHPSLHFGNFAVLNPKGIIAMKERSLLVTVILLMLIVVVPTFIATIFIVWKYRAGNKQATYSPDAVSKLGTGALLWTIPAIIIFTIGVLNWKSTHELDPYKAIASDKKPITIQVVALQWKWLFIYPDYNIATVNFIQFPVGTPVSFQLTADAPMNSFWIPQLGGQMYAMPGMSTTLHLLASEPGEFNGSDAEISGAGFTGMKFIAKASSQTEFDAWVKSVKQSSTTLSLNDYTNLAKPSENNAKITYSSVENNLYDSVIMKFMMPSQSTITNSNTTPMQGMENVNK